jgi:hypothetical protein
MDETFGERRVAYDPSDPEANKLATAAGMIVVHGGSLSAAQWENVRRAGAIRPAGQVTPSPRVLTSPDGRAPIPRERWASAMEQVAVYAQAVAREVLGFDIEVEMHAVPNGFQAWYGGRCLSFNLTRLGRRWFETASEQEVDELLLHELAHEYSGDHLSSDFHHAICRLGARLRRVGARLR